MRNSFCVCCLILIIILSLSLNLSAAEHENIIKINSLSIIKVIGNMGFINKFSPGKKVVKEDEDLPTIVSRITIDKQDFYIYSYPVQSEENGQGLKYQVWQGNVEIKGEEVTLRNELSKDKNIKFKEVNLLKHKVYIKSSGILQDLIIKNYFVARKMWQGKNNYIFKPPTTIEQETKQLINKYTLYISNTNEIKINKLEKDKSKIKVFSMEHCVKEVQPDKDVLVADGYFAEADSWSEEMMVKLGDNIADVLREKKQEEKPPELQLLGVTDKKNVTSNAIVRYTYYLFNTGAGEAKNIKLNINIPEEVYYIGGSINADCGQVYISSTDEKIFDCCQNNVSQQNIKENKIANSDIKELIWKITDKLKPGVLKSLSFLVKVK